LLSKAIELSDQKAALVNYLLTKLNRKHLIQEFSERLEREERFKWYYDKRLQAVETDQYETPKWIID
jgi:hypothetical protein